MATVDDRIIPNGCTGTPTVTVSAPPALVDVTCPTGTTVTVSAPTGTLNGEQATATSNDDATVITLTNPGSGYDTNPLVTVSGGTCTGIPTVTAVIDVATKQVTSITFDTDGTTGTTAYAISNISGTIASIPTNGAGAGYTTAPIVTVTG